MKVVLCDTDFDPWQELCAYQNAQLTLAGKFGATAVFVGTMRDYNENAEVQAMYLEHYPGMTEKHLEAIIAQAHRKWFLLDSLIIHRTGEVLPHHPIVLVAVWSAHRREAFEASRFIMEDLKSSAPFWKRETRGEQTHWVEKNTPGS